MSEEEEDCGCGQEHTPLQVFMNHVSEVVFGAQLVSEQVTVDLDDGTIPAVAVGIADDEGNASFFALAFTPSIAERIQFMDGTCPACVDEMAEEILRGVDLDKLLIENPDDKKE